MKKLIRLCMSITISLLFYSCENKIELSFQSEEKFEIFDQVESELLFFLNDNVLKEAPYSGIKSIHFNLKLNPEYEEAAFMVLSIIENDKLNVHLSGQSPSDILYAAYTFLEKGGYLFEITGPVAPQQFNWETIKNYEEKIVAKVKKRGIRQHINFTMDVSSWSLDEAKSYIQNLSRMRFNYITFHSYPGQWYEVKRKDTTEYAGHFFYGDVHQIPDHKIIQDISENETYFCIPEIEPVFEDKPERSKKAIEWLQQVILEAKNTGMGVQLSIEPRNDNLKIDSSVETVKAVLKQYPMIDALEIITEEAGGWGPSTTKENTIKTITEHFGHEFTKDSIVMQPVRDKQTDLAYIYGQIGHNAKLINYLKSGNFVPENIDLKLGIYSVLPSYAKPAFYLARKLLPETEIAIMPGHHSNKVKDNVSKILISDEDWDKSIIYSWIEFDGMMYIQQNGISGIQHLVNQAVENSDNHRANAILYNHWRTAENKITARYASESGIYGGIEPREFYRNYAKSYGIQSENDFASAILALDKADLVAMKNVSGFAFCWVGRWRKGGPVSAYSLEKLQKVRSSYEEVLAQLKSCSYDSSNKDGSSLMTFLDNRIRTTIIYIKAFEKARELAAFNTSETLSSQDKTKYVKICNEALAIFEQYIEVYAEINADRGTAGNLISLWYGPIKGIKLLREKNGGIPFDQKIPIEMAVDEPPLPIINQNN